MERNESVRSSKGVALINQDLETPDMNFEYSVVVKETVGSAEGSSGPGLSS